MTKKEFLDKTTEKYGDFFEYNIGETELDDFLRLDNKIHITCKKHGIFVQKVNSHLHTSVCDGCRKEDIKNNHIEKFVAKHGNEYDYSLLEYNNKTTKIKIICKVHGIIEQTSYYHLKYGCTRCHTQCKATSLETFIDLANKEYNNKYDYSIAEYKNNYTKLKIICPIHGIFEKRPQHHLVGMGCKKCSGNEVSHDNNITVNNPEIMKKWDYSKNEIFPENYLSSSPVIVSWKCDKGHVWKNTIRDEISRIGYCKLCENTTLHSGYNLLVTKPDLAALWHPIKNGELKPVDVTPKSNLKVWWKCDRGHEWKDTVNRKFFTGCPKCNMVKSSSYQEQILLFYLKKNLYDLTVINSSKHKNLEMDILIQELQLVIEYDGHRWHKDSLERDVNKNNIFNGDGFSIIRIREKGLPKVDGSYNIFRLAKNVNNLKTILEEILIYINSMYSKEYILLFDIEKDNTDIIASIKTKEIENSLASKNENLAKQWHPTKNGTLLPSHVSPNSELKVWWLCEKNHEWFARIDNRNNRNGCPCCSGRMRKPTEKDNLAVIFPKLAKLWDYTRNEITPYEILPSSGQKVWWIDKDIMLSPNSRNKKYLKKMKVTE